MSTYITEVMTVNINNGAKLAVQSLTEWQPVQEVQSSSPTPDRRWEHVDSNGHYHAHGDQDDDPYPTLDRRSEHVDCDGSCGGVCDGEGYNVDRYYCRICRESIEPGTVPGPHTFTIPLAKTWSMRVDGGTGYGSGDLVSVRVTSAREVLFGVACVTDVQTTRFGPDVTTVTDLEGVGPLGRRKP